MSVSFASLDVRADKKMVVLQIAHWRSSSGSSSKASRSASVTPWKNIRAQVLAHPGKNN